MDPVHCPGNSAPFRIRSIPKRGTARGIELFFRRDTGKGLNWWASYALTSTRETHRSDLGDPGFQNRQFPRDFDQAHSLSFDLIYRPVSDWFLGLAWQFRSGWPYTSLERVTTPTENGPPNYSLKYGDFYSQTYPSITGWTSK